MIERRKLSKRFLSMLFIIGFGIMILKPVKAQFLHSYGATVGITLANQTWQYTTPAEKLKMRNLFGFNASLFAEFLSHPVWTWVMEIQYNQMGARWIEDPVNRDVIFRHRLNYASFNNFLKARTEGIDNNLYVLAGPRIMYQLSSNAPGFSPLTFAVSGGLGLDYNYFDPIILFAEAQYIYGITSAALEPVRNRAFEIRLGVKKLIGGGRNSDVCPPVYL